MIRPGPPIAALLAASGALLLAHGCGGRLVGRAAPSPGADAGVDAAPRGAPCYSACPPATSRPVALPRPECPESEPVAGAPCTKADLRCGYGGGRTPYCRTEYQCTGTWQITARPLPLCPDLAGDRCSPRMPEPGAACVVGALVDVPCEYDELSCRCAASLLVNPGDPGRWLCYGPPADVACPEILPNVGEGCTSPGHECWYDPEGCLDPRLYVACREGTWQRGTGPKCLR